MTVKYVDPTYRHYAKVITPGETLAFGASLLKWYDIARIETPVEPHVQAMALRFLKTEAANAGLLLDDDVGFSILHRCGAEFYFLIVCTWRGNNELWETVFFKPDAAAPGFALFPQSAHKGTFCVWEAGVATHEIAAWSRFLISPRDEAALNAYLHDRAKGGVE